MISTERLEAQPDYHATDAIDRAATLLRVGKLVAFPTETVYGLGGLAATPSTVAAIFAAKKRPAFNPLISHYASVDNLDQDVQINPDSQRLIDAFFPGPLTLVLPVTAQTRISELARAGLPTAAVRVPSHPIAHDLLSQVAAPVAAPSANLSGKLTPTSAEAVREQLEGRIDAVLDGGDCVVGLESTVVALLPAGQFLLRPGGISREAISSVLGAPLRDPPHQNQAAPLAPGRLAAHYAPHAAIRLNAPSVDQDEAILDFAGQLVEFSTDTANYLDLSPDGDLIEAAANLYAYVRRLDQRNPDVICVAPIPTHDLGEAINDRLARAAAS